MSAEDPEIRLKRLKIRSWRRGTREMDLILGPWSDANLASLDADTLDLFEALLSENDHDLHAWVTGREKAPERFQGLISAMGLPPQRPGNV